MKSLEIVNRNIKAIKKLLYNLKDIQEGTKEDFDKYYHGQELKEQEQIKQSLEVLEIIRKKRVDMKLFAMFCVALTNEEILFSYNSNFSYEDEKLTMEELLKLKKWMEVDEG